MRKLLNLLMAMMLMLGVVACNEEDNPGGDSYPVTAINLDQPELTMKIGESSTLKATITPAEATEKEIVWSSGNDKIATVDQSGKVTAVAEGEVVITAVSKIYNTIKAECSVTVEKEVERPNYARIISIKESIKRGGVPEFEEWQKDEYFRDYTFNYDFKYDDQGRLIWYRETPSDNRLTITSMFSYSAVGQVRVSMGSNFDLEGEEKDPFEALVDKSGRVVAVKEGADYYYDDIRYNAEGGVEKIEGDDDFIEYSWVDGNMTRVKETWVEPEATDVNDYQFTYSKILNDKTSIDLNVFLYGALGGVYAFEGIGRDLLKVLALADIVGNRSKELIIGSTRSVIHEDFALQKLIYSKNSLPKVGNKIGSYSCQPKGDATYTLDGNGYPTACSVDVEVTVGVYTYNDEKTEVFPRDEYEEQEWRKLYGEGPWYTITRDKTETKFVDTFTYNIEYAQTR